MVSTFRKLVLIMAVLSETGDSVIEPISSRGLNTAAINLLGNSIIETISSVAFNLPTVNGQGSATIENIPLLILPNLKSSYGLGLYYVTGTVVNGSSAPLSRKVLAISRSNDNVLDSTYSDPVTGEFVLNVPNEDVYVVCIPEVADGVNAEIYDRITPVASI